MPTLPLLLEIQTGKHRGRRIRLLRNEILVGRGEEATIRIASTEVSREHCRLIPESGQVRVIDLKSRNGTFVDGRPVNGERLLSPGGMLTVGPLTFLLVGNEEVAPKPILKVALKGKTGTTDELSDDKIVNWLSDYELPVTSANASKETSIIRHPPPDSKPGSAPVATSVPADSPVTNPHVQPAGGSSHPRTRPVREEAREIIRLHLESIAHSPIRES